MTSFILKIIGIITMLCDHIGDAIVGKFTFLNYIGRIAFPIFAYQSVQGYIHTKNLKKHLIKLFIFALISQAPFMLFLSTFTKDFSLNIFFTLFMGLLTLFFYEKCKNKLLGFAIVIICSIIAEFTKMDYGAFGVLLIFIFYFFEVEYKSRKIKVLNIKISSKKVLMPISVIILCFSKYLPNITVSPNLSNHYLLCGLYTALSLIFILIYNKKQGPKLKYFFYIFYPLHLLILYFIHIWM